MKSYKLRNFKNYLFSQFNKLNKIKKKFTYKLKKLSYKKEFNFTIIVFNNHYHISIMLGYK